MQKIKSDIWFVVAIFFVIIIFADLVLILFSNGNLVSLPTHTTLPYGFDINNSEGFWAQRGQWCDMLSGHFAAMAFILLFYTATLQRRELKETSIYMKYNRLFNQLGQYIDGIYINQSQSQSIRISGYSALSEIIDIEKRPEYYLVNFAHIKFLIYAYFNVAMSLNKEDADTRGTLSKELEIVIGLDNIMLLWKLYICSELMMFIKDESSKVEFIKKNHKNVFNNKTLQACYLEVVQSISNPDGNPLRLYRKLMIQEPLKQ